MEVGPEVTAQRKASFLASFRVTGNVSHSARLVKVDRKRHREWFKTDPEYKLAFDEAQEEAVDALEEEARRRAVEGVRRLKFHKGVMIMVPKDPGDPNSEMIPYTEHEYSDMLLICLLNANRPDKYKRFVDMNGGGMSVQFTLNIGNEINITKDEPKTDRIL